MDQIERIKKMESILDEGVAVVEELRDALDKYIDMQDRMRELFDYYESQTWRDDFDDDSAGKIPADIKRGVLSEDAVYNLIEDNNCVLEDIRLF